MQVTADTVYRDKSAFCKIPALSWCWRLYTRAMVQCAREIVYVYLRVSTSSILWRHFPQDTTYTKQTVVYANECYCVCVCVLSILDVVVYRRNLWWHPARMQTTKWVDAGGMQKTDLLWRLTKGECSPTRESSLSSSSSAACIFSLVCAGVTGVFLLSNL